MHKHTLTHTDRDRDGNEEARLSKSSVGQWEIVFPSTESSLPCRPQFPAVSALINVTALNP